MALVNPPNPIKTFRTEKLKLSQEAFASKCGTSKMLVIRAEQGCYVDPPPAIENFLQFYSGLPVGDFELGNFRETYHEFQRAMRRFSYGILANYYAFDLNAPQYHPFIKWREYSNLNQTQVAKYYCVHPAVLFKFENQPHLLNDLPTHLVGALLESGYSEELVTNLANAYRRYKDYQGSLVIYGSHDK